MLYYFKIGKNTTEMQKKKGFLQCMEKALRMIKHVKSGLRSFHAGNFLLDDAPQLGRPGEVNSEQIETH